MSGAPNAWPPPPPPRKLRLTWLWIVLGILLFLGVVFVASIVAFVHTVEPPVNAMNHFLAAVDHRDYDRAYALMCRREQNATSRPDFPAAIAPFASDLDQYRVYSFDPFGNERTVQYSVTTVNGHDTTYRATMIREAGAWRVCDFFKEQ
jgi:hypothetical protein